MKENAIGFHKETREGFPEKCATKTKSGYRGNSKFAKDSRKIIENA